MIEREVTIMNPIFNNLESEKQELIINAAIKEFVKRGFEKASTNEIVKEARISKGSLFNYFNNKKDLYIYLIEYGIQVIENLYEKIDLNETDLFKRIENIGLQKLYIHQKFPHIFDFLAAAIQEESAEVKDMIKEKVDHVYERGIELIYKQIDYSKFREDIDIEKAIEILNWTMFGFSEKELHQINTFEDMNEFGEKYLIEWKKYSEILRYSFYK
ncbi:TetR family transcriptional regulator [Lentibacillus amyloliquefaciens]|uniref:TetR family transcriptional regulator n=2 Tax=Lentibacillus amyloliquefaciens TaxID=1472767 RepID=A0A0U4FKZ8_9BACI|nr:TetR family transcriptional regulator [Lentibacillus amyloliquefaciens]